MKKINKILIAVALLVGVVVVFWAMNSGNNRENISELTKPGYGEGETVYKILVESEDKEYEVEISVPAKEISEEELPQCFEKAFEKVLVKLPGDNQSLDYVTDNLNFVDRIDEYGMDVYYAVSDESVMDCFGKINSGNIPDAGRGVVISAYFQYGDKSQMYQVPVTVYPKPKTDMEMLTENIQNNLKDEGDRVVLPTEINGKKVSFFARGQSGLGIVLLAVLAIALAVYNKKIAQPKKAAENREKQMKLDYSEIVSKLSLLMGAGMSQTLALKKIATDYKSAREQGKLEKRYAYEEIAIVANRIETGVSEVDAYASMGKACKLHSYIKLCNLLSQNIRKGSDGFNAMLRNEVTEAFMERKAIAKKTGEEAGTKLLLPMILMLMVVLIIIIVPAFMSF